MLAFAATSLWLFLLASTLVYICSQCEPMSRRSRARHAKNHSGNFAESTMSRPAVASLSVTISSSLPNSEHWSNMRANLPSSSSHTKLRKYAPSANGTSSKAYASAIDASTTRAYPIRLGTYTNTFSCLWKKPGPEPRAAAGARRVLAGIAASFVVRTRARGKRAGN